MNASASIGVGCSSGGKSAASGASSPDTQSGSSSKKSTLSAVGDVSQNFLIASSSTKTGVRRKSSIAQIAIPDSRAEPEVVIHVCDEVKGSSRDFSCPQKLLITKMGYFADVTAGQRLEDMDISVHCDLQIFEWLMKWVKKESMATDEWPALDPTNVIPILVSASFLQMEPLLLDCLSFCHARLNEVVKASANLACLNDSIITRLAAMFTNLELEVVKDKKDRIAPRLWTKLIQSLCDIEPQALRGHYATLVGMFRCLKCGLLPTFHVDGDAMVNHHHHHRSNRQMSQSVMDTESESDSDEYDKSGTNQSRSTSSSSDGEESEYSSPPSFQHQQQQQQQAHQHPQQPKDAKRKLKLSYGRHWAGDMSARSNQDNQREFEERAMKQIISMVGKRTGGEQNSQYQTYQQGGTYIKLETDWRESIKQKNLASLKVKSNGTK
uniref:DUF3342 domain-containing protein n=1 Tax=Anopheles merus TaxID=30066 RepID=A0A182UQ44_ANOME